MNENKLQSANHATARTLLRMTGPLIGLGGLIFIIVGLVSFFSAFGTGKTPENFWCVFVGIPLLFVGIAFCMFGYLASFQRYVAGESAPVAKDVVNYMGENTQPGVTAMTKAIMQGIKEGREEQPKKADGARD